MNQHEVYSADALKEKIQSLREQITGHALYGSIRTIPDIRVFMRYHVYAVWDFMSLLKSLQNQLTCTSVPWFPKGSADTRYLINEIVVGEECDVDQEGLRKSHFELYLEAMQQSGADTTEISSFIRSLQDGTPLMQAFDSAGTPAKAVAFVNNTFEIIMGTGAHVQAAVFTFGREDLIPGMFHSMVSEIAGRAPENLSKFQYYLERHIEVDGDHHSQLALQMTEQLCAGNPVKWREAEEAVLQCLRARLDLWTGAYEEITRSTHRE